MNIQTRISVIGTGLVLLSTSTAWSEVEIPSADDWYKHQYAPIWADDPGSKVEEGFVYYAETLYLHPPEGPATTVNSRTWLTESVAGWVADGWQSSVVAEYRSDQLNATTVSFKVKWKDLYEGGHEEYSCGWYMADFDAGRWAFTQYGEIDCAEHDL